MNVNQAVAAEETTCSTKAGGTTRGYAALDSEGSAGSVSPLKGATPREHDVVIDIKYCGICHSDIHQTRNEWGDRVDLPDGPRARDRWHREGRRRQGDEISRSETGLEWVALSTHAAPVRNVGGASSSTAPCTRRAPTTVER